LSVGLASHVQQHPSRGYEEGCGGASACLVFQGEYEATLSAAVEDARLLGIGRAINVE